MPVLTHRLTVKEYYRLEAAGILAPGQRVELLEGQVVDMMPFSPFHSGVARNLHNLFAGLCAGTCLVDSQNPLRIDDRSEPVPDVMLLRLAPDNYRGRHPGPEDVLLLVEVADSSVAYDREDKLPLYAQAGIAEYWIVDLVQHASKCSGSRILPGTIPWERFSAEGKPCHLRARTRQWM